MRVLHLLNDGPAAAPAEILQLQAAEFDVEVIDLSSTDLTYEELVDKIFASDKVVSW